MKLKNGDNIKTIYGEEAIVLSIGKDSFELTKLDRDIQVGVYTDGVPCISCYAMTGELEDYLINGEGPEPKGLFGSNDS